jgi:hypothetical protein
MYLNFHKYTLKFSFLDAQEVTDMGPWPLFEILSEIYLKYQNVFLRRTICYSAMPSIMFLP